MLKEEKKRVFLIVVLIILIIVYTFELISLGILKKNEGKRLDEDIVDKEIYYTISFDEDNGNEIKEEKQKANEKIKLYTPSKEGYVFSGWLLNGISIDNDYIVTSDIEVKAKWLKEDTKYVDGSIDEYNDNDIEPKYLGYDYLSSNTTIKYKIENNIFKISFNKIDGKYPYRIQLILNDIVIDEEYSYFNKVRMFKFNDYYILEFLNTTSMCQNYKIAILDSKGNLIGKNIEVEGYDYRSFKYLKENNEIISMNFKCFTPTLGSNLKKNTVTYKIEDNQLKIINSIIKKEDTYYIYDEFGSYKALPKEDKNIYEYKVNGKLYLFNEKNGTNGNTIEIYDNNLNKLWIITGLTDTYARYVVNTNNTTTFNAEKEGVFVIFDSNMNLIHESKNYEIVGIVSDYVIVIKNGKARILDLEENEVTVFNELPSNYARDIYYLDNNNITFRIKDNSTGNYWVYKYNLETKERSINKED